jgi:hypothetical protein
MASTAFYEHPNRQQSKRAHRHSDIDEAVGVMKLMASLSLSPVVEGAPFAGLPSFFFQPDPLSLLFYLLFLPPSKTKPIFL